MILIVGTSSVIMMESFYQKLLIVALLLFPLFFISRLKETESLCDMIFELDHCGYIPTKVRNVP